MTKIFTFILIFFLSAKLWAETKPDSTFVYKTVGEVELTMHMFFPPDHHAANKTPAIVFFHGGGWNGGGPEHFYNQSKYLASRGMVCLSAEYRTKKGHGTSPAECVKDAKSAMRWVRKNASLLGIDGEKILAGGGSAGGHMAAATATVDGFNERGEDTSVSCVPKALVLFNPVANNGPEGYGYNRVKEYYKEFSPYHNLSKTTPPTLIMLGTKDKLFKPDLAREYKSKMETLGARCDLILYEDQEHAFFNQDRNEELHYQTMIDADNFLISLGYLMGQAHSLKELARKFTQKPNLVIIHTDEHNLRTLGCYRKTMPVEQAFMWGKDAFVKTPNIDKLAEEGVLCENFYASSPVCTPSRASMISGLYPIATGSHQNDLPLNEDLISFAQILKDNGYATSYVGKWHLDGDDKPGIQPERNFGFDDNRYMINRGHWKTLGEDDEGLKILDEVSPQGWALFNPEKSSEKNFTTDFLVNRSLEIIERDKDKPFCLMLSIPDPHGPDKVRKPYSEMYLDMKFEKPKTAEANGHVLPLWNKPENGKKTNNFHENGIAQYFGMVKCIDDNVGRLMGYLKEAGLDENTIVVFTSDHGDLMGEHGKLNKGLPYEMSARVPFVLKYPGKVKAGKQIRKAYTMADFTPSILGLMDVDHSMYTFHGVDASDDFKSDTNELEDDRIVYMTNAFGRWVAAVNKRYKLVLSPVDKPWLFDLQEDPDEMINFYNNPDYNGIAKEMEVELFRQMEVFNEPLKKEDIIND